MIWLFWRLVETVIIYLICSLFSDPPHTLGITVCIEFGLVLIYLFRELTGKGEEL